MNQIILEKGRKLQIDSLINGGKMRFKNEKFTPQRLFETWMKRSKKRNELRFLSDQDLRDIGLTRADVVQELDKPLWF